MGSSSGGVSGCLMNLAMMLQEREVTEPQTEVYISESVCLLREVRDGPEKQRLEDQLEVLLWSLGGPMNLNEDNFGPTVSA